MAASPRLTRALHQQLGDELSREVLTWMGMMDSNSSELMAFRDEFTEFVGQTNRRFDALEGRFDALEGRFDHFETSLDARLDAKLDATFDAKFNPKLEAMEHRLAALLSRQYADLLKWSFVFWCGSVVAVTALVLAAIRK